MSEQPATPKQTVKVDWRAFLSDVKAHVPDSVLETRYGLSAKQVQSAKSKLVEKGMLDSSFVSQVWTCPKCQFQAPEQPSECPRCGIIPQKLPRPATASESTQAIDTLSFCPKCGQQRVPESNFCARCGSQLSASALSPETRASPDFNSRQRRNQEAIEQGSAKFPPQPWPEVTDRLPWLYLGVNSAVFASNFNPMLGPSFYPVLLILSLAAPGILFYDKMKLDEVGFDTRRLRLWWFFFSPVYLTIVLPFHKTQVVS